METAVVETKETLEVALFTTVQTISRMRGTLMAVVIDRIEALGGGIIADTVGARAAVMEIAARVMYSCHFTKVV